MSKLRYVKTLEQVAAAAEANPEFLDSTVRSIRAVYQTDPAIAEALVPQPLEAVGRSEIHVTFSHVAMHITPEYTLEIGSGVFGVLATYEGVEGIYIVTMPMSLEAAVVGGRETFGEPKKIADIDFRRDGDELSASISRMGMTYLSAKGRITEQLGARELTEHAYCYKAFPSCDRTKAFDTDPLLVRLDWQHKHETAARMEGELVLGESPIDPVADVPIRRLLRMEYEQGTTQSNGTVLRSVPGQWLLPFLHGRYDDSSGDGIEIAV